MSKRRQITLTHEGWYYVLVVAFIAVGAVWQQVNLMILMAGLMVGPLLLSWRTTAATMRQLRVRRHLPRCVHAGESFAVEIVVRNMRRRLGSWFVVVKDRIHRQGTNAPTHTSDVEVLLPRIAARESSRATYQCSLPERGSYDFVTESVSTRFPLGLIKCVRRVDGKQTLVVLPRLGQLTKAWYQLIQSRQVGMRRSMQRRAFISGGELYGVRDWQPHDSRRLIHWRVTAKLGALAVRQFEELDNLDVTLVLDLWQDSREDAAGSELVETAVSFAATAVKEVCRQGGMRLRMILLGDRPVQLRGPATSYLGQKALQELAFRAPCCGYDPKLQLLDVAASTELGQQIIVISTRTAEDADIATDAADSAVQFLARRVCWLFVGGTTARQCFAMREQAEDFESVTSAGSRCDGDANGRASTPALRQPAAGGGM